MAEKWTKMSVPSSCWMKPYPLLLLNHFTLPLATAVPPCRTKKIHKSAGSCGRFMHPIANPGRTSTHDGPTKYRSGPSLSTVFSLRKPAGGGVHEVALALAQRLQLARHLPEEDERPLAVARLELAGDQARLALDSLQGPQVLVALVAQRACGGVERFLHLLEVVVLAQGDA